MLRAWSFQTACALVAAAVGSPATVSWCAETCTHLCVCTNSRICIYVSIHACQRMCRGVLHHVRIYTYAHTIIHIYRCVHVYIQIHTNISMKTSWRFASYTHLYICKHKYTYTCTCIRINTNTYIHINDCVMADATHTHL